MKNTNKQKIVIENFKEFRNTINDLKRVERVLNELKNSPEVINNIIVVSYSDEGYATFDVIVNTPRSLTLSFSGTAC